MQTANRTIRAIDKDVIEITKQVESVERIEQGELLKMIEENEREIAALNANIAKMRDQLAIFDTEEARIAIEAIRPKEKPAEEIIK